MKSWKVVIRYNSTLFELQVQADSYADAYLKAEEAYQGCIVKSISEIRSSLH